MAFKVQMREIFSNPVFTEKQIVEMAFYVKQTIHRYLEVVNCGYLQMEEQFAEEEGDTVTKQFKYDVTEHVEYAQSSLLNNLLSIYEFCFVAKDKKAFLQQHYMSDGYTMGGFNDAETMSPSLSYQALSENGVMDDYYDGDCIHRLFITFFATLKLIFGSLHEKDGCPDMMHHECNIYSLGVHPEYFSFRELTLLSGYQTERAIRNLASPSTPEHRKLAVVKEGRLTFVTHQEAIRWLSSIGRI